MSGRERLGVEVLGPLRVTGPDGGDLTPDGALQRRLLALLVLRRGHVVPVDLAVDVLWPGEPPRDPPAALQNHLSRLRSTLPEGLIASVGEGYRLDPDGVDVDADQLSRALAAATGGDPSAVAEVAALHARWQGPAYPELEDVDDGRFEAQRLEELRVEAQELVAEHRLASGDTAGLVAQLVDLAGSQPLRERPRALLMEALAVAGRRAEALRVYDDFRRVLGDELGIEPSAALTARHADLLDDDVVAGRQAPADRLPAATTTLVGRRELVDEVTAQAEVHRLVTLVGPGGVGKTRVLVEVGHRLRAARDDRPVVLCELAAAGADSAHDAVAAALGVDARPGVALADRLAAVLGDAEVVVLLDNCEHVLEPAAALVEQLLARCSGLRVVATSRERLRLPGEHLRTVPPLALDGDGPAVRLFLERAGAVRPEFAPDEGDLESVAEIVRRLDGLPLAIELAAARLHTHGLDEVAAGLEDRFSLLSSGFRTSDRHGSLGAAVSWSFGQLDEDLQRTFAELSVFAGPFTARDAAAVASAGESAVRQALADLVERSLVTRVADGRFALLETLRAYGADRLVAAGGEGEARERHALHQVAWVEEADRRLAEPGRPVLAEIDDAIPEIRAAFTWLVDHGRLEPAGRLLAGLLDYGLLRLRPDVMAWAERLLAADPGDDSPQAPLVWVVGAYAAWMAGDLGVTGVRSERARVLAEQRGGDPPAVVPMICGSHALFEGRLDDAAAWYRRSAEVGRDDPQQRSQARASELLALGYAGDPSVGDRSAALLAEVGDEVTPYGAYAWYCAGESDLATDPVRARERLTRALELAEPTSTAFVTGLAGASRASIDARTGDPAEAAEAYRVLIGHWRRAGMWSTQWTMLRSIALLLARLGRLRDAAVLEGAVRAAAGAHRIFGADATALDELGGRLRAELGDGPYAEAVTEGAVLDGDAAVEHALGAL